MGSQREKRFWPVVSKEKGVCELRAGLDVHAHGSRIHKHTAKHIGVELDLLRWQSHWCLGDWEDTVH